MPITNKPALDKCIAENTKPIDYSIRLHPRVSKTFKKPSLTKQQFKHETNINTLVNAYLKTGEHTYLNPAQPNYGYATSNDFLESLIIVDDAQRMFAALPSGIRTQFDNDPAAFLAFTADPANLPQMAEMGLLTPEAAAEHLAPPEPLPGDPEAPADTTPPPLEPE